MFVCLFVRNTTATFTAIAMKLSEEKSAKELVFRRPRFAWIAGRRSAYKIFCKFRNDYYW